MNIDHYAAAITVRGTLEPDDCEPLASATGRRFLPHSFEVTFQADATGGWKTRSVKITGGLFKQDGTPGRAETSSYVYLSDPDVPEWVRRVVAAVHPDAPAPRPHNAPATKES
ncbi:hypothetical protein [Streptomyces sp. cg35]|uniref:hypothetical protein n=1 Tax=Streptomyces sp. cg35 TaxID=3421650 RepID=UPI003D17D8C3